MKKNLLFIFAFASLYVQAQTLTQAFNEPVINDKDIFYGIDTSAYQSGLPIGVKGNNVVWNYTNLSAMQPRDTSYYVDPGTVSGSSNYPGCSVVQKAGFLNTFIKSSSSPTTQTEVLGINSGTLSLTFTNSAIAAKYPISYGSGSTDNIAGSYTALGYSGPCTGVITTTADGFGTLNLPNGYSFNNVLRVKSVQNISMTQIIPIANVSQTIYNYYHNSQKFPILSVNYTSISFVLTGGTPTVTGFVTGNVNAFVTSIAENDPNNSFITIYPNPAQDFARIKANNIGNERVLLELFDVSGRMVRSEFYDFLSVSEQYLSLKYLAKGLYTVIAKTDSGQLKQKLVIN